MTHSMSGAYGFCAGRPDHGLDRGCLISFAVFESRRRTGRSRADIRRPEGAFDPPRHYKGTQAAGTGHNNDQGGRRVWILSDAQYWQPAPRQRRWPQRRGWLRSRPARAEQVAPFFKKAAFSSTLGEPVSAFRLLSFAGGGL